MNAKLMITGLTLLAGLGAAVPASADSFRLGIHGRDFGFEIGHRDRPVYVAPAPDYVPPVPVYVAPPPVVVEEPVYVDGGYYVWERGHRVFHRGRYHRYRR